MMLDRGLVFMSDTRTNAGLDNISTFGKLHVFDRPGERVLTLLFSGQSGNNTGGCEPFGRARKSTG